MRHIESARTVDFAAIYDNDVEMVSVARDSKKALQDQANRVLIESPGLQCRWIQRADDHLATESALSAVLTVEAAGPFTDEILAANEMLGELLGCDQVGVRMMALQRPMCPRFHVDVVPCRLLITMTGPGTEWISKNDVDGRLFAERGSKQLPLRKGAAVQQLSHGAWSLLKGGAWQDDFEGVVHRSPSHGDVRLLISIDPLFTQDG